MYLMLLSSLLLSVAWLGHFTLNRLSWFRQQPRWAVAWWRSIAVAMFAIPLGTLSPWKLPIVIPTKITAVPPSQVTLTAPALPIVSTEAEWNLAEATATHSQLDVAAHASQAEIELIENDPSLTRQRSFHVDRSALYWIWVTGVAAGLLRWCWLSFRLSSLLRKSAPASAVVIERGQRIAARYGYRRRLTIRVGAVQTPCVIGSVRPTILLPLDFPSRDHDSDLDLALAHELAHLVGRDLPWDAVMRGLSILGWFHPLTWLIARVHRAACEHVSDLTAANLLGSRDRYAKALARLALKMHDHCVIGFCFGLTVRADILQRLHHLRTEGDVRPLSWMAKSVMAALPLLLASTTLLSLQTIDASELLQVPAAVDPANQPAQPPRTAVPAPAQASTQAQPQEFSFFMRATGAKSLYDAFSQMPLLQHDSKDAHALPAVAGRIQQADQRPAAGVLVALMAVVRNQANQVQQVMLARTTTDSAGQYSFPQDSCFLPSSQWDLAQPFVRVIAVSPDGHFAKGAHFLNNDTAAKLQNLDAQLQPTSPGQLTYLAPDGSPIAGAAVVVRSVMSLMDWPTDRFNWAVQPPMASFSTDDQGKCQLPVMPRDSIVYLEVVHPKWAPTMVTGHTVVDRPDVWVQQALKPRQEMMESRLNLLRLNSDGPVENAIQWLTYQEIQQINTLRERPYATLQVTADPGERWQGQVRSAQDDAPVAATLELEARYRWAWPADSKMRISTDKDGKFDALLPTLHKAFGLVKSLRRVKVIPNASDKYLPSSAVIEQAQREHIELKVPVAILIEGKIIAVDDQQPLSGIAISVSSETMGLDSDSTMTTDDGRFRLPVAAGKYVLTATTNRRGIKLPRTDGSQGMRASSKTETGRFVLFEGTAQPGQTSDIGTLQIERVRTIRVEVRSAAGQPVAGAKVKLHRIDVWHERNGSMEPRKLAAYSDAVVTDSNGRCQVRPDSAEPTEFQVSAWHEAGGQYYYGQSPRQATAGPPLTVTLQAGQRIHGRVTHNGQPLANVPLQIDEYGDVTFQHAGFAGKMLGSALENIAQTSSDAEGRYHFVVPANKHYRVLAQHPKHQHMIYLPTELPTKLQTDAIDFNFVSGPARLVGKVLMPDGTPQPGVTVFVKKSVRFNADMLYNRSQTTTDNQGRFELMGLPRGTFELQAFYNTDRQHHFEATQELPADGIEQTLQLKHR